MKKSNPAGSLWFLCVIIFGLVLNTPNAASQPKGQASGIDFSFSAAPIFQSRTNLDRGGKFSLGQYMLRFAAIRPISDTTHLGFSIGYDYLDYDFSEPPAFAGAEPWRDVHRVGFGLPVFYRANKNWQMFITPSIDWAGESGADFSEALRYGAAFSAIYRFSPDFFLGAGFGVFHGLEETNLFPYLTVHLKISEKWLLTNPFSAGPIGPAGLELIYSPDRLWEIGGGGAYRSNRFRLDNKGVVPDGIGQSSGLPAWMRISRKFGRYYKLDLYGGALLNGELRIEDRDGHKRGSDDFDSAAFMALNISARF